MVCSQTCRYVGKEERKQETVKLSLVKMTRISTDRKGAVAQWFERQTTKREEPSTTSLFHVQPTWPMSLGRNHETC